MNGPDWSRWARRIRCWMRQLWDDDRAERSQRRVATHHRPHLRIVDATPYGLADHVAGLVPTAGEVHIALREAASPDATAAVVLLPLGPRGEETDEALRYLSALAGACEQWSRHVPLLLVLCVRADERFAAMLSHESGGIGWRNHVGLSTATAWTNLRARHPSDGAALREVDSRLRGMLEAESHLTALGGSTPHALRYLARTAGDQLHFAVLAECLSHPGIWHGHHLVAAAIGDLLPVGARPAARIASGTAHAS